MHSPISISYSVRLHVARSTQMGKARASRSGMSNRYRLSRFLFLKKCNQERRLLLIIKMDNTIYQKSFIFEATQFEEYQDGLYLKKGTCRTTIIAKVLNSNCIAMLLQNEIPVKINQNFGLPIFGSQSGDVLEDRIQYGRVPDTLSWHDSNEPVVCNIFNNHTCIRFAMMSPMRIVEFYGKFTDIRTI